MTGEIEIVTLQKKPTQLLNFFEKSEQNLPRIRCFQKPLGIFFKEIKKAEEVGRVILLIPENQCSLFPLTIPISREEFIMHLVIKDAIQVPTYWQLVLYKKSQGMAPDSTCFSIQSPVSPKSHLFDLSRRSRTSYIAVDANGRMWENIRASNEFEAKCIYNKKK